MNLFSYISGFVDGEGCFCVSFQPSHRHQLKWEVRPSFSVSQNSDRSELLYRVRDLWSCGSIRPDRSDKTLKYEVRCIEDLMGKVIPHFRQYPLMSSKQKEVELFDEICRLISNGGHRNRSGFTRIVELAMKMNLSGKRKYSASEIITSLKQMKV